MLVKKFNVSRDSQDEFALNSHLKAISAIEKTNSKAIKPSEKEVISNPRARSAKLRSCNENEKRTIRN